MTKRIIIGHHRGASIAAAMLATAARSGGMFVKPTDLGGSIIAPERHTPAVKTAPTIGKLSKTRGRL